MADKEIEIGLELDDSQMKSGLDAAADKAAQAGERIQKGLEKAAGGAQALARELDRAADGAKKLDSAQKKFNWSGVSSVASSAAGFTMMAVGSRMAASKDEGKQLVGGAMQGVGAGVGMGASFGSMIAPGIGTAIGAAAGALVGAGAGLLNAAAKLEDAAEAQKAAAQQEVDNIVDAFGKQRDAEAHAAHMRSYAGKAERMTVADVNLEIELTRKRRNSLAREIKAGAPESAPEVLGAEYKAEVLRGHVEQYAKLGDELQVLERRLAEMRAEEARAQMARIAELERKSEEAHRAELARREAAWEHDYKQEIERRKMLAEWRAEDEAAAKAAAEAAERLRQTIESDQRARMGEFSAKMKEGVGNAARNDLTRIGGGVAGLSGGAFGNLLREANVIARQSLEQLKRINNVSATTVAVWGV